ncbi:type II toxin-antitoxin system VapC family toxin [bacterium]|nr:type II toxin-antitoxin system VapC family toxin [bacterium]
MRKRKRKYVVDSYSILSYLQKESGWQEMGQLLRKWRSTRFEAKLSWINWGEIYYMTWKYFGKEKAQEVRDLLIALPLELEPVDFELVALATELKAEHNISYADAFCAATAIRHNAILVTGDPEFKSLDDKIDIRWLD